VREAASRCIRRRAFALLALVAITATLQASPAGAASKRILTKTSALTVTQATATSLSISWQRVRSAAGYDLYLNGARIGTTKTTSYTFSSLRCGTSYTLGVDAFSSKGVRSSVVNVVASTPACPVATAGNDTSPPTAPSSLSQGATTATTISLLWGASVDNVGVAGYDLFLNGTKVGTTASTSYTFASLSCGTSYMLAVDAYDGAGNRSQSTAVQASTSPCADTSPPTIPGLPTQSGSTATSISLVWGASLDNVGVAGYDLFVNGTKVGTTTGTSYTFINLSCGTSYTLAVDAFDGSGNRSQSAAVQASTTPCPDTSPPTTPGLPTKSASTATSISILWGASLDNVGVAGYDAFKNGSKVGTTTATSYTFSNLSCGTSYTLAVDAYDAAGNRSSLSSLSATTGACASTAPSPSPTSTCTATLSPGGNYAAFVNGLSPGAVGCVHGGSYGFAPSSTGFNNITVSGTATNRITVQSYPGETATIGGHWEVTGSFLTFKNLKIDFANSAGPSGSCWNGHAVGITVNAHDDIWDHVEAYASLAQYSQTAFLFLQSNDELRYSKIHDWGICLAHDHGVYNQSGSGAQIHDNWFWESTPAASGNGYGNCVQNYPSAGSAHIYSNVCDGLGNGFGNCTSGSDNLFENNIVTDSTGHPNIPAGALIGGCGPQSGSTGSAIANNDQFNNPGGFGTCGGTPPAGETCSGNISVNPQFKDAANHNYTVLNTSLAGYGLWDGS
jgi:chitodextrinase